MSRKFGAWFLSCLSSCIPLASLGGTACADIQVDIVASPSPAEPGELLDIEITVTNDGAFDLTDVSVVLDYPVGLASVSESAFDGVCPSTTCDPGEQVQFTIPTLDAGAGLVFSVPSRVSASAMGGDTITLNVAVFDNAIQEAADSAAVTVVPTRELQLVLSEDSDPAVRGESFRYTLTYGVLESSPGSPSAVLQLALPQGVSFESASGGGSLNAGVVEWSLGNLNPGSSGERTVTVSVPPSQPLGDILSASALLMDGAGDSIAYECSTRVELAPSLGLVVTASPDPARPGETLDMELTVTNTGPFTRTNVSVVLEYPDPLDSLSESLIDGDCPSTTCDSAERVTFAVGDLAPGAGRTFSVPSRVGAAIQDGAVVRLEAVATSSQGDFVETGESFAVDATEVLELAVVEDRDPVEAGQELAFTLGYGVLDSNAGAISAVLEAAIPDGTTFLSASDGGVLDGSVVRWTLGNLDAGESGQRRMVVLADPGLADGETLIMEAVCFDSNASPRLSRHRSATRVQPSQSLEIDVTANPNPARKDERIEVSVTVANTDVFDRTGVVVLLEYPDHFASVFESLIDGDCASTTCDPRERVTFSVGDLPAGEGRTYTIPVQIDANAMDGTAIAIEAEASDNQGGRRETGTLLSVQSGRTLNAALSQSEIPAEPLEEVVYTLTYATRDSGGGVPAASARLWLPDEMEFVSASNGGVHNGNVVTWPGQTLNPGQGADRTVTARVAADAPSGSIPQARATVSDASTGQVTTVASAGRVLGDRGLSVGVDLVHEPVSGEGCFDLSLSVTNESLLTRTDVVLRVRFPSGVGSFFDSAIEGDCPSTTCDPAEFATYNVGSLAAGETVSYLIRPLVSASPDGAVLSFTAWATDSSGAHAVGNDAVLIGRDADALCVGDLNGDTFADFSDVFLFISGFGASGAVADIASPCDVFDFSDVFAFLTAFGNCP